MIFGLESSTGVPFKTLGRNSRSIDPGFFYLRRQDSDLKAWSEMLSFDLNPFDALIQIFQEKYPEINAEIFFASDIEKHTEPGVHGVTNFPDDGTEPFILISTKISVESAIEVLAHELAHLAIGPDTEQEHCKNWESVFNWLHEQYCHRIST